VRLALEWAGCVAVALGLALLATVPLRFESSYAHLAEIERKVGDTRPLSEITAHPLRAFDQSWPAVRDALTTYVTYPVLALAVAGLVLGLWRRPHFTALVAVWAVAQVASVIWLAATPYPRYLAPALPFVLLLASVGVQELARLAARVRPPVLLAAGVGVLVPALVFDVQVSSKPASAPFPAIDKEQYVTGYAAGTGLHEADDELKTLAHGRRLTVLSDPGKAPLALYVLTASDGPKVEWVWRESPDAKAATVLLDNGGASPPPELGSFHEVWRYQRPDGGVPIVLSVKHS